MLSRAGNDIDASAGRTVRYARDCLDDRWVSVLEVAGVRTRVYERGSGVPLVLIHGGDFASLYSLDCWSLNLESLAQTFRVVAYDKPGQGHTDNPPGHRYTFEFVLEHARALLDRLGVVAGHLIGHSMGALVASRLALDDRGLAASLTIVDSNTVAADDAAFPWDAFYVALGERTPADASIAERVRSEPEAQAYDRGWLTASFLDRMAAIARLPKTAQAAADLRTAREGVWMPSVRAARAQTIHDIERRGLPVPTLVLWGYQDRSAPYPLALQLFQRVSARTSDAQLHLLGSAGHYCFRDRPDGFDAVVRQFCR